MTLTTADILGGDTPQVPTMSGTATTPTSAGGVTVARTGYNRAMGRLSTSPPPPRATELRRWRLSDAEELRGLRASLHQELTGTVLPDGAALDEVPELIVLIATELATNALRHGIPPTIVRLLATDDFLVLDVADHDLSPPPELGGTEPTGAGGRGLHIAQRLSLDVGWYATDTTKNIWATFPRR